MALPRSWSEQEAARRREAKEKARASKKKNKAAKKRAKGKKKVIIKGLLYWQ